MNWDKIYKEKKHISIWPWSDLISFFLAHVDLKTKKNIIEIGFGAGANIPFFQSLNVNYHGIEFSETIFELVKKKYPELKDNLFLGDFINFDYKDTYDIIVDRSSLTHNTTNQIKTFLENISKHLHRNSLFIGIDWFADDHFFKKNGNKVDENTFTFSDNENIFNGLGTIHFSSYIHIKELFNDFNFSLLKFQKKSIDDILDEKKYTTYNFIAKYNGQNY